MDNLALQTPSYSGFMETGVIEESESAEYLICYKEIRIRAQKAAGCLLTPEAGDKVLFFTCGDDTSFIVTILERSASNKQRLVLEGDADLICRSGKLGISADQGLALSSTKTTEIKSNHLSIIAEDGICSISRLSFFSNLVMGRLAQLKILAGNIESICERLQQRAKRSYRIIEETDYLKAEKIDYQASELMTLRGKHSMLTAQQDVKINGERIHMG